VVRITNRLKPALRAQKNLKISVIAFRGIDWIVWRAVTNHEQFKPSLRVALVSLGCAKNLVDSEVMLGVLARDGIEITNEAELADVVVVNTCSFIDAAQEESVDTILASARLRQAHQRGQALVVAGCLPQRFQKELPRLLPEVDVFMGLDQVPQITQLVRQAFDHRQQRATDPISTSARNASLKTARKSAAKLDSPLVQMTAHSQYIPDYGTPRFRLTPPHFAYVKIAEGCNHPCSFCIIPQIRGRHRSRPPGDIVLEARQLISQGVRELNLISQDTTYYGLDLQATRPFAKPASDKFSSGPASSPTSGPTLSRLLCELEALPGDFWIRLLYTHPAHWTPELVETLAQGSKVARYVDVPLQHIHPVMLERMRRETSQEYITDLLANIRARIPGITLRTTFIVGFPGETEACFETLLEFIEATRFERLGVFTYSPENGTRAAKMAGQVPGPIKEQRRRQVMALQRKIAREMGRSKIGQTLKVLLERKASDTDLAKAQVSSWEHGLVRAADRRHDQLQGGYLVARAEGDAPDIDGRVYVRGSLAPGTFAWVTVTGHTDYDLIAEPAGASPADAKHDLPAGSSSG
jgi:ribosomal protein S12 methylthiotransferase